MRVLNGITILLAYQLLGEVGALVLRIPIPGPVLGMLLLFITLLLRRHTSASLDTASTALLRHLSLLFVPAGVGMIVHFDGRFIAVAAETLWSVGLTHNAHRYPHSPTQYLCTEVLSRPGSF